MKTSLLIIISLMMLSACGKKADLKIPPSPEGKEQQESALK